MLNHLLSLLQPRAQRLSAPLPATAALRDDDVPRGCGWFDSSHDLHRGLCVQEHASPDTLAQELPLANWLELQLSGWRVTHPA